MSDMHTLDTFAALADDAARDAAMARALGWRQSLAPPWCAAADIWERGTGGGSKWSPPPYFTGGDSDPFANWALLAEVWRLLPREDAKCVSRDWHLGEHGADGWWEVWSQPHLLPSNAFGDTPHRAACLAAVAAGLVPREEA